MKDVTRGLTRRDILELAVAAAVLSILPLGQSDVFAQGAGKKPKIGIIGSGKVGSNLGGAWAKAGYEVMFSSRNLEEDRKLAAGIGASARAGTPQEAAAFGDVVLFAVPYAALPELGKALAGTLKGKVVIDACNPIPARDGKVADEAREQGAGLYSAKLLPGARIVRAFNAIGAAVMGSVNQTPGRIGMPLASDDAQAIEIASRLIKDVGFEPVLVGKLAMGKYLMPGTPLAGQHSAEEIRTIAATLTP
jgi:8-hydroxy-5-deazaflavin:NADPH oxidoreductase